MKTRIGVGVVSVAAITALWQIDWRQDEMRWLDSDPVQNVGRDLAIEFVVTPQPLVHRFIVVEPSWDDSGEVFSDNIPVRSDWGCYKVKARFLQDLEFKDVVTNPDGILTASMVSPFSNEVTRGECIKTDGPPIPILLPSPGRAEGLAVGAVTLAVLKRRKIRPP